MPCLFRLLFVNSQFHHTYTYMVLRVDRYMCVAYDISECVLYVLPLFCYSVPACFT